MIRCKECEHRWSAEDCPVCPRCFARDLSNRRLISKKHDPGELPYATRSFRSVLSWELRSEMSAVVRAVVEHGTWLRAVNHGGNPCIYFCGRLPSVPGSAVFGGDSMPTVAMDGVLIADAWETPHIYPVESAAVERGISVGVFVGWEKCGVKNCTFMAVPGNLACAIHSVPARAEIDESAPKSAVPADAAKGPSRG